MMDFRTGQRRGAVAHQQVFGLLDKASSAILCVPADAGPVYSRRNAACAG